MKNILSLPCRRDIRLALGSSIAAWARAHGHKPQAVHVAIQRFEGKQDIDMARCWGEQTAPILRDLHAACEAAREAGEAEHAA